MAKLEVAKETRNQALELLALLEALRLSGASPGESAVRDWEANMGGRDAAMAWVAQKVATMPADQLMAVRWSLMDQRRALLSGLEEVVAPAIGQMELLADRTVQFEEDRHRKIRESMREGSSATAEDYIELCQTILRRGLDRMKLAGAFRKAVADHQWPDLPDRTRRHYFDLARKRIR